MRSARVSDAGGGGSLHSLHTSVRLGEDAACHRVQSMSAVTEAVPSAASSPAGCAVSPRAPAGGRDTGSPSTLPHSAASPRGASASVSSALSPPTLTPGSWIEEAQGRKQSLLMMKLGLRLKEPKGCHFSD